MPVNPYQPPSDSESPDGPPSSANPRRQWRWLGWSEIVLGCLFVLYGVVAATSSEYILAGAIAAWALFTGLVVLVIPGVLWLSRLRYGWLGQALPAAVILSTIIGMIFQ